MKASSKVIVLDNRVQERINKLQGVYTKLSAEEMKTTTFNKSIAIKNKMYPIKIQIRKLVELRSKLAV